MGVVFHPWRPSATIARARARTTETEQGASDTGASERNEARDAECEKEGEREIRGDEQAVGGGLWRQRVVVFEMIRPICASFPRCTPRRGKPARIPHHRKHRRSPVECHIFAARMEKKGTGGPRAGDRQGRRAEQGKRNGEKESKRAALKKEGAKR